MKKITIQEIGVDQERTDVFFTKEVEKKETYKATWAQHDKNVDIDKMMQHYVTPKHKFMKYKIELDANPLESVEFKFSDAYNFSQNKAFLGTSPQLGIIDTIPKRLTYVVCRSDGIFRINWFVKKTWYQLKNLRELGWSEFVNRYIKRKNRLSNEQLKDELKKIF